MYMYMVNVLCWELNNSGEKVLESIPFQDIYKNMQKNLMVGLTIFTWKLSTIYIDYTFIYINIITQHEQFMNKTKIYKHPCLRCVKTTIEVCDVKYNNKIYFF